MRTSSTKPELGALYIDGNGHTDAKNAVRRLAEINEPIKLVYTTVKMSWSCTERYGSIGWLGVKNQLSIYLAAWTCLACVQLKPRTPGYLTAGHDCWIVGSAVVHSGYFLSRSREHSEVCELSIITRALHQKHMTRDIVSVGYTRALIKNTRHVVSE